MKAVALATLRQEAKQGFGYSVEGLETKAKLKSRRKELRAALAELKAEKLVYTMGKMYFAKSAKDWKKP